MWEAGPVDAEIDALLEEIGFSGVVRFTSADGGRLDRARGLADRSNGRAIELSTRFGTASATKGLTALTIMSLAEDGLLSLDQSVASLVGAHLPLIDEAVTIRHLLEHTSGIGDYLDEEALGDIDDHVLGVSVHTLERPLDYAPLMTHLPQREAPGEQFRYNNGGFIVLSIIIEMVAGSFHDAVRDGVLAPAGLTRSGFFRTDDLPADVAVGYLEDGRTNVFHLPVIGGGDGGIYLTLGEVSQLWDALFAGSVISLGAVEQMTSIHKHWNDERAYGLGFWMRPDGQVTWLEGMDAGVSFKSARHLASGASYTVMSNTSSGAWPVAKLLDTSLT